MTEQEAPEPTLADALAAIELLLGQVSALAGTVAALTDRVGGLGSRVAYLEQPTDPEES